MIEIPDSQEPTARLLYAGIAQEKWKQLQAASRAWDQILPILCKLAIPIPDTISIDRASELKEFDAVWGWAKKAKYILLKYGPLPTKKIVDILATYEADLDYRLAARCISSTLSADSRKGKFVRIEWDGDMIYDVVDREKAIQELNNSNEMK